MPAPEAEVRVDAALIAALLRDQFPELAGEVRVVANGWDNVIARVGDSHCVRMPRRALAAPLVQHEAECLPFLAPQLPVEVPVAVATGAPGRGYPWTWLVCPWFDGRQLADLDVAERIVAARQLGGFVAALHTPAPPDAPVSPWRGVPLSKREQDLLLPRLELLPRNDARALASAWRRAVHALPHAGPAVWSHGDLHPLNVLVDPHGPSLRAVIDWGDVCSGDPAVDLAIAWLGFDEPGREAFRAAAAERHPPQDPVWVRALGWAVILGLTFIDDADTDEARSVGEHVVRQLRLAAG